MSDLRALIEAVDKLGLRSLVAGWNGEGRDKPFEPHPARLKVTLKTNCGTVYQIDALVERLRAKLGEGE
jgi:hypothetical protein